ncbi:uncharacterized protein TrAFT101_005693 [Trichoderma asperellum]|uniref:uncharacterized protein n=1 Tax=Trichoderma asperellum TaxID=101201 RepID=UPI00331FD358|nr:hypothetical protein TrAFT101_005693 [Trichoderma asperellum]
MCLQYITKCRYCGYWKHYSWDRCRDNRILLEKGCAIGQPSQHPSECEMFPEDNRQRLRRQMTPYECPVEGCKSTAIAKKLFEERAKAEAKRAAALAKARAEWEAKDKARKAEFAAKYFKKLPVVRFSERRQSFLNLPASDSSQSANDPSSRSDRLQWRDEYVTAEDSTGNEVATSMHSQVFEDSDDDFISESSEEEDTTPITKYIGAIDIKGSVEGRRRGKAFEFHDDGMPIRTVTP